MFTISSKILKINCKFIIIDIHNNIIFKNNIITINNINL